MTTKEAVFAWAMRISAERDICVPHHFVIKPDGRVYAMPEDGGWLAWWPLPYLGPEGEAALAAGELFD